ncbi:MAG: anhydro-N-acetylmuramic acid kinase [Chitinophagaceae bacterium]|nr:anhydro-N-acetylmuramic acid kinase [Chitinophagaceae bacterium]
MVYRAIGIMSGSSLDGLDIAMVEFHENSGKWGFEVKQASCYPYTDEWREKLKSAINLNAFDYLLLHTEFGHYVGSEINRFIESNQLEFQVQLISSHGHTTFHSPDKKMTGQLGDGAAIAAQTGINVVSDLRAMDIALGGQGAPIVPIGEKLLWPDYQYLLNLGGIANLSLNTEGGYIAFDVCPANRVLDMLAQTMGKLYDEDGSLAAGGKINLSLLDQLNNLPYYSQHYPKSLANDFGTDTVYPLIVKSGCSIPDALATYTEHIALQIKWNIESRTIRDSNGASKLLVTGGGAHNGFLISRLKHLLAGSTIDMEVPTAGLINFKEAIVMALIGVLRWREENNVLASVTGASRDSIGGAVWIGQQY